MNPDQLPLKGYWMVIHDSGITNLNWNLATWWADYTVGGMCEVYVRAGEDRQTLSTKVNCISVTNVVGRYIELRAAIKRKLFLETSTARLDHIRNETIGIISNS